MAWTGCVRTTGWELSPVEPALSYSQPDLSKSAFFGSVHPPPRVPRWRPPPLSNQICASRVTEREAAAERNAVYTIGHKPNVPSVECSGFRPYGTQRSTDGSHADSEGRTLPKKEFLIKLVKAAAYLLRTSLLRISKPGQSSLRLRIGYTQGSREGANSDHKKKIREGGVGVRLGRG